MHPVENRQGENNAYAGVSPVAFLVFALIPVSTAPFQ